MSRMKKTEVFKYLNMNPPNEGMISNGAEFVVISSNHYPFALKIPIDSNVYEMASKICYKLSADSLGGLIAPFSFSTLTDLGIQDFLNSSNEIIIQQRVDTLSAFSESVQQADRKQMARQMAVLEKEIIQRGMIPIDNYPHNMGYLENKLLIHDLGQIIPDYNPSLPKEVNEKTMHSKGYTIYYTLHELERFFGGKNLKEVYMSELDLNFDSKVNIEVNYDYLKEYPDQAMQAVQSLPYTHSDIKSLISRYNDTAEGIMTAIILHPQKTADFQNELIDILSRLKFKPQMIDIAKQEYKKYYNTNPEYKMKSLEFLE